MYHKESNSGDIFMGPDAEVEPRAPQDSESQPEPDYAAMMAEAKSEITASEEESPMSESVPKAAELFTGDINDAVIKAQQITGVEINDLWWAEKVGNQGTAEEILARFDTAYPEFVASQKS